MTSRRRVLAILRAGDASLHPGWLTGASPQNRNWDLHLSYFGDRTAPFPDRPADVTLSPADVTLSFEKGTKAIGTVACIRKLADRIWSYDWVWLPDDGLAAELGVLNRFFEIIEQFELDLAQPALGAGSYVSHDITRQRPHMALRFTTFVDIMAACFSRCALRLCLPYLGATVSSWGPSHLSPKLLGYPRDKIAIVDETPVVHTRPIGRGPNIALAMRLGVNPNRELQQFLRQHRLTYRLDTWGGLTRDREYITDLAEIDRFKSHASAVSRPEK